MQIHDARTPQPIASQSLKATLFRVLRCNRLLGLSDTERRYLEEAVSAIPSDKLASGEGVLYVSQGRIAARLDRSAATVRRVETALDGTWIERKTGANGRRSAEDGMGISVAPLIARLPMLLAKIEQTKVDAKRRLDLIADIRRQRAWILRMMTEGLPETMAMRLAQAVQTKWPRQIGYLTTERAEKHQTHLKAVKRWIEMALTHYMSDGTLENERSYTKKEEDLICRVQQSQERREIKKQELRTIEDLADVATPELKFYIEAESVTGNLNAAKLALLRGRELGISAQALEYAIARCGMNTALAMIVLIDGNKSRPANPIRLPEKYLLGLIEKACAGAFHLSQGLLSLRNRSRHVVSL